jgi:hypothetical protein
MKPGVVLAIQMRHYVACVFVRKQNYSYQDRRGLKTLHTPKFLYNHRFYFDRLLIKFHTDIG